ncbi:hypothetical protein HMPREF9141_0673 [Prevotella multiformis DSM 16608]|uniref:Uncharacterized protein n=1 Tax=Prevotella multiformis DSM 16608 TaxID=888743 RepID=F0F507_9BACT|nr:hypothetical protein HMPREF9141_0673 [Prevotella multiformis DSM 16608]
MNKERLHCTKMALAGLYPFSDQQNTSKQSTDSTAYINLRVDRT